MTDVATSSDFDTRSTVLTLGGTFVLRGASYAAGFMIPVALGLKSRNESGVTVGLAALIAVAFYASELLFSPLFGALSDRIGRKPFLLLGPVLGAIAIQLFGFVSLIPVIVLVRVLQGLSTAACTPATLGYLSVETRAAPEMRARVMGLYEAVTVVGLAMGGAAGGALYDRLQGAAFSVTALLYLIVVACFATLRSQPVEHLPKTAPGKNLLQRMLSRDVLHFAPAWLAANAILGAWFAVAPFLAAGEPHPRQFLMGGYSPTVIGLSLLVFGVLFTLGAISWGFVMPVIGRQTTMLAGVIGLALFSVSTWLLNQVPRDQTGHPLPILMALVMLSVLIESGFTPAALAYLSEIADRRSQDRGSVMGVYSVLLSLGQLVGGALAGLFTKDLGVNGLIILTGLLCVVAALTVLHLGLTERRQAVQSTAPAAVG